MKHDTEMLGKFKDLKAELGLPLWQVKGLLESLWHYTAINTPEGDIGRHSNERICRSIEYDADPETLCTALVKHGWLDESDTYRLIVHDWNKHAPGFIQKRVGRSKMDIVQTCPDKSPPIGPDKSGITQPNPIEPKEHIPKKTNQATDEQMKAFWAAWTPRKRVSKKEARVELGKALAAGASLELIVDGAERYCVETKDVDTKHIMHPHRWLAKERFTDAEPQKPKPPPPTKRKLPDRYCAKCKQNFRTVKNVCPTCGGGWFDWQAVKPPRSKP